MGLREKFVARFGEDDAKAIEAAADRHVLKDGADARTGSDPFRWALVICIGYQCMEIEGYRKEHNIVSEWIDLQDWIIRNAELKDHDGGFDAISMFAGTYNVYCGKEELTSGQ